MTLLRAIVTVGGLTLVSRLTGFARDIAIAAVMGAGTVTDAFFVAFKFPNLFRRLFAEGAFSVAFVPMMSRILEGEGREEAKRFAEEAMTLLAVVLLALVTLMQIVMPWAMYGFAPGFTQVPGKMELATELTRITFPYLLFISLVSLQSGVLNALGRFAAAAAAPILLNLSLLAALFGLAPYLETPGHALAWGVSGAGVVQFLWLAHHCRREGMPVLPVRPRLSPRVKTLMTRLIPGAIGVGVYQLNLLVDTIIASLVADGAVSYLYYADRVTQLPLGVVGIAVGTALLPLLSKQLKANDLKGASDSQNRALEVSLLLTLPAAAALMVIAGPVIAVLFERGAFTVQATAATSAALQAFALGLPAYVLVKVLAPGFYAREDTATPVKVAAVALAANVVLNLILMGPMGHVGIALATALSAWINVGLLAWLLRRKGFIALDERNRARLPRIAAATAAMTVALAVGLAALSGALDGPFAARAGALGLLVAGGLAVYALACRLFGAARFGDLKAAVRRPRS